MEWIVLVGFLPCDNGHNCDLHPFGWGNWLVLNGPDYGVGIHLCLQMTGWNEIACYTINSDGSDGCRVCFVARKCTAGENGCQLNGSIVEIVQLYKPNDENWSMLCLYHHRHGYAYANVIAVQ